jgi:hypothetical protein
VTALEIVLAVGGWHLVAVDIHLLRPLLRELVVALRPFAQSVRRDVHGLLLQLQELIVIARGLSLHLLARLMLHQHRARLRVNAGAAFRHFVKSHRLLVFRLLAESISISQSAIIIPVSVQHG